MTTFLSMTLGASILIVITALLRLCFLHRLPKRMFTLLWAVAMLRLLVPFSVPVSIPVPAEAPMWTGTEVTPVVTKTEYPVLQAEAEPQNAANTAEPLVDIPVPAAEAEPAVAAAHAPAPQPQLHLTARQIAYGVWAAGAAGLLGLFLTRHIRWRRRYQEAIPAADPVIDDILRDTGCGRKVQVKLCQRVPGPLTYGLFRPVILLPKGSYPDRDALGYILAHELTHIRRLHVLYKGGLVLALCLHWFNPLVWLLYILANRDLELSCDEAVLQKDRNARKGYALTLLSLEEARSLPPLFSGFAARAVEERIRSIMKFKKIRIISLVLAVLLVLGSTGVFAAFELTAAGPVELVLYTDELTSVSRIVRSFNAQSQDYHITIESYGRKASDIPPATGADILAYSSDFGFTDTTETIDLLTYLNTDPDLNESSFIPSLYTAMTEGGHLYWLPNSFKIDTFSAPIDVVGECRALSPAEALNYASELSSTGNDGFVFEWLSASGALSNLAATAPHYIDLSDGSCSFDSSGFVEALMLCAAQPEDYGTTDATLLTRRFIAGFAPAYHMDGQCYVGFPTGLDSSHVFSVGDFRFGIPADSENKDAAWEFIKFAMQDAYQKQILSAFPVTQSAFDYLAENSGDANALSDENMTKLLTLIETTTEFWDEDEIIRTIIYTVGNAYLQGDIGAQSAADEIQDAVSQYLQGNLVSWQAGNDIYVELDPAGSSSAAVIPSAVAEGVLFLVEDDAPYGDADPPKGDLAPGESFSFDAQPMAPGQTVTLSAAYAQSDLPLEIGVIRPDGSLASELITGGGGVFTYSVTEEGTHSIWVSNPSEVSIDFVMSYIVT